jgi:mRNA-degrading endonuclease RelE of RelBE toxin-antitoxin system
MVNVAYHSHFEKIYRKIRDGLLKIKVEKHIEKIISNPEIGKPMRNVRAGTREVHIPPFRFSYVYLRNENKIIFMDLYHKDRQ